jgi:hypothetical protein
MTKIKQMIIFLITNETGKGFSLAPTKLAAKTQIAWFLPKQNKYIIEPIVINRDL